MPCVIAAPGKLTMWSKKQDVIVGASCEYANPASGKWLELASPSAQSPYIKSRHYCALNTHMMEAGLACGRCYKIKFDGKKHTEGACARPGDAVIQVVGSGATPGFDCHDTVFKEISGCNTGKMDITYEPVDCETKETPTAMVIGGHEDWMKMIFSGLKRPVARASIKIGSDKPIMLQRKVNSATWWSSLKGTKGSIPVSFTLTLDNSETVELTNCFNTWPQPKNAACTSSGVQKKVVAKPQPAPKKVVAPKKPVASSIRCGKSWAAANSKCGTTCTSDAQCVAAGEKCFKDLSSAPCAAKTLHAPKNVAKQLAAKKVAAKPKPQQAAATTTTTTTAAAPTTTTTTTATRSTTTTATTTTTTTTAAPKQAATGCVAKWAQCGGMGFPDKCCINSKCVRMSQWYSHCQ